MKLWDTLLIVGGADSDRPQLRELFQDQYNLLEADHPDQALFLLEQNQARIAAVIVDMPPPASAEVSFTYRATRNEGLKDIPVLVLITPSGSGQLEEFAFSLGASDVIPRPYTEAVVRHRVQVMVDLFRNRRHLLNLLENQAATISHTNEVMVDALSSIIEYRSAESGSHIFRIRRFTEILLQSVARSCPEYELTPNAIASIASAAALHDIGKISIPDSILNKPGKLTQPEIRIMQTHTTKGGEMIQCLAGATSEEYLRYAYNICRYHHERWDGSGYPDGLAGENIPLCAQVVGLADAFDALTTQRIYKPAIPGNTAANMILNGDCGEFSPKLLDCFKHVCQQFIDLAKEYADGLSPKADTFSLHLPSSMEQNHEIDSLQMSRLKYQAMMHYAEGIVTEMDLNRNTYHVVYNPVPNFRPFPAHMALSDALESAISNYVHPEDLPEARKEYNVLFSEFFAHSLRRHSFSHRLYIPSAGDYQPCQVTFLALNTEFPGARKAIMVWRLMPEQLLPSANASFDLAQEQKALLYLSSNIICRRNDLWYTITMGSGNLTDLTGYSHEEIRDRFLNRFLNLVHPDDRRAVRQSVAEQLRDSNQVELEYRVRHKDGHTVWVLERGFIVTGEDGQEHFYGTLIDNSKSHAVRAELEAEIQRNQIIINQTDNVVFEWDITNGQLEFSPNYETIFGHRPAVDPTSEIGQSLSRVHPDDMASLHRVANVLCSGAQTYQETELRAANIEGRYLWFRVRLTALLDEQGTPYRAIGILINIDAAKQASLALHRQARQDPLTNLLNKATAQASIREYLESKEIIHHAALLMIDLDNFKGVNDHYGHLFGDATLTRAAQTIRKMFRGGDIIGRVGGDEFMVLMKEIRDDQLVQDRCSQLIEALSTMFHEAPETADLSCSIGAALSPEHGSSFQELYQRADQALYHSKKSGKGCYTVYRDDLSLQQFSTTISTHIESNDLPGLANSGLVRAVLRKLSQSRDLEKTIQEVLAEVGRQTNVSRIYIFENNDDNTCCSNTFEWCNEGVAPVMPEMQDLSYETDLPGWQDHYDENGVMFCTDISQLPQQYRDLLEPQKVKSMLLCAMYDKGVFRGYIGLDECEKYRIWTQEQVDLLTFLSEVVVSFLLKKRMQDRSDAMTANLHSILDTQDNWAYVIDPETYRLHYLNSKTRQSIPGLHLGDTCYEVFAGRSSPCEQCPMRKLSYAAVARSRLLSPAFGKPIVAEAVGIQWNGKPACLVTCK